MKATRVESLLLRLPLGRPVGGLDPAGRTTHLHMLAVHLETDTGPRGFGFALSLQGGGRAMKAIVDDDLAPLVLGEDPMDHERLAAKVYGRLQTIGRRGLVAQAYAAVDLALWDLKGQAAGLPLYKLLGGARESVPAYVSDAGWLWMTADDIAQACRPALDQGLMGIKVRVGGPDPEADAERVTGVREALGEDVWLAVDAGQRYDYGTALSMGRFFEEEIAADWFEEPLSCEDIAGHSRLAAKLEVPIALGESLFGADEFLRYLERDGADVLQPDVTRLGGLTAWLKVATLAGVHHRPLSPHVVPELGVHLACGLPNVQVIEHVSWLAEAFDEPLAIRHGQLVPPARPGLGLRLRKELMEDGRLPV